MIKTFQKFITPPFFPSPAYFSSTPSLSYDHYFMKSFSPSFRVIQEIINNDNLNSWDKQKAVEVKLREFGRYEVEACISQKGLDYSNFGIRVITKQLNELDNDFKEYFKTKAFTKYKPYFSILKDIDTSLILSVIMSKCIPFTLKYKNSDDQPVTKLFFNTGNALLWSAAIFLYKKDFAKLSYNPDYNIPDYMRDHNLLLDEEDVIALGCDFIYFFSERSNFFEIKDVRLKKDLSKRIILPKGDLKHLLDFFTLLDSEEIPMVVKPIPWKINKKGVITQYGGTISNNEFRIKNLMTSINNPSAKDVKYNEDVINTLNKMASVKYVINRELFDIITRKVYFKSNGERLIIWNLHKDSEKLREFNKNKDYVKSNEITSHNSRYSYEISILNIASLLYNCEEIYFTNFLDWRGRIYTSSTTLNIQGGELARALILLKDGEILNELGVNSLKIYLANAFGLNKKSKFYRLDWVNKHIDEIIACPDNDFWLKAEEPLMFLACALELKGYLNNPDGFISRLPILIDATCNGLQHLSAMTCDIHLAQRVNITKSSIYDDPRDIYSELLPAIKQKVALLIEKEIAYSNLKYLNITRKLVKRGIMTITYGVTKNGILEQLISEHFYIAALEKNCYVYKTKAADDNLGDVGLTKKEIYALSSIIYDALFDSHEVLKNFMYYFDSMVELLGNLELPMVWITPSGLVLTQGYIKFTKYDITTAIRGIKPKKITLRKPVKNKDDKFVLNKTKQMNAFIPNFIHSFDAAHIVLILRKIEMSFKFNIMTIHDCFGTHANNAELLAQIVKECFIKMYFDKDCVKNFHDHILNYIKLNYKVIGNKVIGNEGVEFIIPNKPNIGELEINKVLPYSTTFTS